MICNALELVVFPVHFYEILHMAKYLEIAIFI